MRARIGLKFGTLKGLIKADLCTNFGRNAMNIHGVMTDYLRKIRSKVCHAYRVYSFEESVENWYVDGATIIGVPFCGLKGIGIKTMEIWHKTRPVSKLRDRFLWIKKTISFRVYQANRLEQRAENQCVAGIIIIESPCSSTQESDYKPLSYDSKDNYCTCSKCEIEIL